MHVRQELAVLRRPGGRRSDSAKQSLNQRSVCSASSSASSTSMPRYRTVLSSLWTAVHRLDPTAEQIAEMTLLAAEQVRRFGTQSSVALL